ncbi:MAG: DUF1697 domain-containing protein [Bacteroidota bacterium]|nr:DUF1697 domain-containing protein [Bacteroidota bacterium]
MPVYIAMLRGINVSGQKKVPMKDLRGLMEGEGLENVETYIQSGNIIFKYKKTKVESLTSLIEKAISKHFHFDVPVIIRTPAELKEVLKDNPFKGKEENRLYITFLDQEPSIEKIEKLKEADYSPEEYNIEGTNIYFYAPEGYGNAKMNNNLFENKLKVKATTRNWKTVNVLAEMGEE